MFYFTFPKISPILRVTESTNLQGARRISPIRLFRESNRTIWLVRILRFIYSGETNKSHSTIIELRRRPSCFPIQIHTAPSQNAYYIANASYLRTLEKEIYKKFTELVCASLIRRKLPTVVSEQTSRGHASTDAGAPAGPSAKENTHPCLPPPHCRKI